jgi:Histidine kinase/Histidine kinase-, DNA gyrase B-, and HSP90-like ATPase
MLNFYIPPEERSDMISRLIISMIIAATVTLFLSVGRFHAAFEQAIYCFLIAVLMWLFIDVGDCMIFNTAGKRFPFTKKRFFYVFIAVMAATFSAFFIGDSIAGWGYLNQKLDEAWMWAFINFSIAIVSIVLFAQRQRHKEERRLTNDARLKLLESQLEPHMLYNTLANLRALVKTDSNLAIHMLDRIVDYMRATLGGSRASMHPLNAEFARIDDYLDLMKLRMGDRLSYSLHLSPELKNHPIPPFILQPLVENAIKHGLEPMVEGGKIFVKADIENDQVVLEVSDTGAGADKDDLFKGNGFGWTQVTERLMTTYGNKATINLIATESYKTSARITFPYIIQPI